MTFRDNEVRAPHLAGLSYPRGATELATQLDELYTSPSGPGHPVAGATSSFPHLIVAPHVDYARGGPVYAWAYHALASATERPELVVIFGTDHMGARPFALTKKHYDTPLGRLTTDVALVDALTERVRQSVGERAAQDLFADEHHHRTEHSIELSANWLRHIFGNDADNDDIKVLRIGHDPTLTAQGSVAPNPDSPG